LAAEGMTPLLSRQFLELMLQLASGGRRSQKSSDDAEAKVGPTLVRSEDLRFFFHAMPFF